MVHRPRSRAPRSKKKRPAATRRRQAGSPRQPEHPAPADAEATAHPWARKKRYIALGLVLLLAAALRLADLTRSPPGLNQDEAANAWNAYCLLETGQDQVGVRWPIFFSRCLGANRSTLYLYLLLPFQAVGGLNIWTTRLPSAVAGIVTVLLTYVVGARLFGRNAGLVAATLLAVNPWHLQQSRWGHEAALCPLLVIAPLATLLWANLPFDDHESRRPRPLVAGLAGIVTGICCYGYPAARLFLPAFLVLAGVVTWRAWWNLLKTRRGPPAVAAFALGLAVTFGPLAWRHVTDPAGIGKRGQASWVWDKSDTTATKIKNVLARYPLHFAPDFLFRRGDYYDVQSPPDTGQFHWYMLPLMLLGMVALLRRVESSGAACILLVWLMAYPIGDCFSQHVSLHALRSLPGLCGLILLAALGTVSTATWLWHRWRPAAAVIGCAMAATVIALNARYLHVFFGPYNQRPLIYHSYHVDLLEACEWLRPRFNDVDAVLCTTSLMNQPYVVMLVALGYDPDQWFRDKREFQTLAGWDLYTRCGKMHFMYGSSGQRVVDDLLQNGRRDRVVIIARPDEFGLTDPVHEIRRPDGKTALHIFEREL